MNRLQLRPTFQWVLPERRTVVLQRLQEEFSKQPKSDLFLMYGEYGELHLPSSEHRLWSPHLSFSVVEIRDGIESHGDSAESLDEVNTQCVLLGRYAPRLEIWTAVWIVYLVCCFTVFFGAIITYVQWQLGESLWGLWVTLGALLIWGGLYGVAYTGQQWSSDQMHQLGRELESILQKNEIARNDSL